MLTYSELKKKPARFLSMTGQTVAEFEAILPAFSQSWGEEVEKRIQEKKRKRKVGSGRKPILKTDEARLLFIRVYFKLYPLQEAQGPFFGMSQSQANEWIQRLTPILKNALGKENVLPAREPSTLPELLATYDLLEFGLDGTERRIQRSQDAETQRDQYSGKKTHTVKNNIITHTASRTVAYLSKTYPGKTHDKRICDDEQYAFPRLAELAQDTGFQGHQPEHVIIYQPKKKPRGGTLEIDDRFINSVIASVRITVENILSGVKRCRILKDVFRNHLDGFADTAIEIACALHYLRV